MSDDLRESASRAALSVSIPNPSTGTRAMSTGLTAMSASGTPTDVAEKVAEERIKAATRRRRARSGTRARRRQRKQPEPAAPPPQSAPPQHPALGRCLLRLREVLAKTGVGASTLYRLIRNNSFPVPIRLSGVPGQAGGVVAWDSFEVDAWIEGKLKQAREVRPIGAVMKQRRRRKAAGARATATESTA